MCALCFRGTENLLQTHSKLNLNLTYYSCCCTTEGVHFMQDIQELMRHSIYQQLQNKKSITPCIQPSFFLSFLCTTSHTCISMYTQAHTEHRWKLLNIDRCIRVGGGLDTAGTSQINISIQGRHSVCMWMRMCVCVCTHVSIKKPLLGRPLQYMRELQMSLTHNMTYETPDINNRRFLSIQSVQYTFILQFSNNIYVNMKNKCFDRQYMMLSLCM